MNQPVPYSPTANVADIALAQASGGRSAQVKTNSSFPTNVQPVAPASLIAPNAAVVALFALTGKVTGRFAFNFNLGYTDSAADTVGAGVIIMTGVTNVTGGTTSGAFTWESSPITVTGGVNIGSPQQWGVTVTTGELSGMIPMNGVAVVTVGTPFWLLFEVTAGHNLSGLNLNAYAYEF